MKKLLLITLVAGSTARAIGLGDILRPLSRHVRFFAPKAIFFKDGAYDLLLFKQSPVVQCSPVLQEFVSRSNDTFPILKQCSRVSFMNLEKILTSKELIHSLCYEELCDAVTLYDYLDIQSETCSYNDLAHALTRYDYRYTSKDLPYTIEGRLKQELIDYLFKEKRSYLLSENIITYEQKAEPIFLVPPTLPSWYTVEVSKNICTLRDQQKGTIIESIRHNKDISFHALSSTNRYIVTGSYDGTVIVYDVVQQKEIGRVVHEAPVLKIAAGDRYVASVGLDKKVIIYDAVQQKEVIRLSFNEFITAVAVDGKYVALGFEDTVLLYDMQENKIIASVPSHGEAGLFIYETDEEQTIILDSTCYVLSKKNLQKKMMHEIFSLYKKAHDNVIPCREYVEDYSIVSQQLEEF